MEVDRDKMTNIQDMEQVRAKNMELLKQWSIAFLERIMHPEMITKMPSQLRVIAKFIAEFGASLNLDVPLLVGGYLVLRYNFFRAYIFSYFNPAIATPEVYNIISSKQKTALGQRNLILITKVIQNVANNVMFGSKEEYMAPMNEIIGDIIPRFREHMLTIVKDGKLTLQ